MLLVKQPSSTHPVIQHLSLLTALTKIARVIPGNFPGIRKPTAALLLNLSGLNQVVQGTFTPSHQALLLVENNFIASFNFHAEDEDLFHILFSNCYCFKIQCSNAFA